MKEPMETEYYESNDELASERIEGLHPQTSSDDIASERIEGSHPHTSRDDKHFLEQETGKRTQNVINELVYKYSLQDKIMMAELEKNLLQQKKKEEEDNAIEEARVADAINLFEIFNSWYEMNKKVENLIEKFNKDLTQDFRMNLYEFLYDYMEDEKIVTDVTIFNMKMIIYYLIKTHKKFSEDSKEITFDIDKKTTNLYLTRQKHIFKCYVGDSELCYFKENGNFYYVN